MSKVDVKNELKSVAHLRNVRISNRKVKIVADLIRNKDVEAAKEILTFAPKAASKPLMKLLLSAVANAENNHHMDVSKLYVAEVYANEGPTLKRIRPKAKGIANRINKRTCHITIVLKERN